MKLEEAIDAAAEWLADHHREKHDELSNADPASVRKYRLERARKAMQEVSSCSDTFGASVPYYTGKEGPIEMAVIHVMKTRRCGWVVFGYLPEDENEEFPSYIWPPEYEARCRERKGLEEDDSGEHAKEDEVPSKPGVITLTPNNWFHEGWLFGVLGMPERKFNNPDRPVRDVDIDSWREGYAMARENSTARTIGYSLQAMHSHGEIIINVEKRRDPDA
jgi:hypothetical protein